MESQNQCDLHGDMGIGGCAPKTVRREQLQQIPGLTNEASIEKTAVLETAKILCETLKPLGLW